MQEQDVTFPLLLLELDELLAEELFVFSMALQFMTQFLVAVDQ